MTARHDVEIQSGFLEGGWIAVCSCGWKSEPRPMYASTLEQSRLHQEDSETIEKPS